MRRSWNKSKSLKHVYTTSKYAEVATFYSELAVRINGSVLEIGCGTGRILIEIAKSGMPIHGVDISPDMLASCRTNAMRTIATIQNRISLTLGDAVMADFGGIYDLVILPFRVIQEIPVSQWEQLLQNIRQHLSPNGVLCFDSFSINADYATSPTPERLDAQYTDDFYHYQVSRFSRTVPDDICNTLTIYHRWEIHDLAGKLLQQFSADLMLSWFTRATMEHLLRKVGFKVEQYFGDFSCNQYLDDSPNHIIVCRAA
jgi:SAM-dependent methyltransferase